MKIELKIDGIRVRMNQKANIAVTHSIADVQEPDNTSAGYSKSVEVPLIPYNMRVFRFTNELYSKEQFNNELHTAEYIVDGNTVMSGVAQIDKITYEFGAGRKLVGGSFHVSVIGAAFEWITNGKRQMNELTSDETVKYAIQEVYDNSTRSDVSLVKFFPVDRGAFWEEVNDVKVPRTTLEIRDYHPFFNVWKALGLIFGDYTVKSSMKGLFESLYCSGYIPEVNDSNSKEANDFYIGNSQRSSLVYDPDLRRVYYNLFTSFTKLTGDDIDFDEDYYIPSDGQISVGDKGVVFKPIGDVSVRFLMELNIETPLMRVESANTYVYSDIFFIGRESISLHPINSIEASDAPNHINIIGPVLGFVHVHLPDYGKYVRLAVRYKLLDENTGLYDSREDELSDVTSLDTSCLLNIYYPGESYDVYAYDRAGAAVRIGDIQGAWMKYIDISGARYTLHFALKMYIGPYTIMNGDSCSLQTGFGHSAPIISESVGLRVQIGKCTIRPEFGNYIGIGDSVGISTIGGTNSQLDYIAALRQMFNLMFYTNPLTKEVFIEPRIRFYNLERSEIVDWRGKIDYSKEAEIEELGGDIGKSLKLAYADGNEVVEYYNWKRNTELGAYKEALLNKTSDDTKEIVNTMFAPFLHRTVESVGMTIPQEKRENTQDTIEDVELGITPIIGYFNEVVERTAGSDKGKYPSYPQLIFQDASKGVNLGFDDIDWMPTEYGLNQYYKDNISAYNVGRRITMYLKLTPQDVEAFQFPNRLMRDFRAVFLLNIDGEDVPCLLESIEDYNPASGASTKCIFISDPDLKLAGNDLVVITYDNVAIGRNNTLIGYK